jgi:hypothetical protein
MYKKYISELKKICGKKGIKLHVIGRVGKRKEYPVFKIVLGHSEKHTVCFSAGIHGEEPAGPWAIFEFIKQYRPMKYKGLKIILFPVANPHGFDKGIRRNFLNKDLNRHFCHKKLSGENKMLYDAVKNERVFFFNALHEDEGFKKFYLYDFEKKPEKIYRNILALAKKYFTIDTEKYIYGDPAKNGLIINRSDGSFEDRLFRDGVPYSMCTETPEGKPFNKRVRLDVEIMNLVLDFAKRHN